MKASRGVLIVALALLAIAALRDFVRLGDALPWRQLYDFADFYCAGAALDGGDAGGAAGACACAPLASSTSPTLAANIGRATVAAARMPKCTMDIPVGGEP